MKYIFLILVILLILFSGYIILDKKLNSKIDCEKINKMTQMEIKQYLDVEEINILVTRVYELGECKNELAIPELKKFINSQRISHILKFKGIRLGKIAKGSIKRIQDINDKIE